MPRKGLVGPPIETPGAQCLGEHRFRYAIIPYAGGWEGARVWRPAADLNAPLVAVQARRQGSLPPRLPLLRVEPPEMLLSALKLADDGKTLVTRVYNLTGRDLHGAIELFAPIEAVAEANLNEEEGPPVPLTGPGRFAVALGPHQIKTFKITASVTPMSFRNSSTECRR